MADSQLLVTLVVMLQILLPIAGATAIGLRWVSPHWARGAALGILCILSIGAGLVIPSQSVSRRGTEFEEISAPLPIDMVTVGTGLLEFQFDHAGAGLLAVTAWLGMTGLLLSQDATGDPGTLRIPLVLLLHVSTTLILGAQHFGLYFTGWGGATLLVAVLAGLDQPAKHRASINQFLFAQVCGLFSMTAGLSVLAGTVALMKSAPHGPAQVVEFSFSGLVRGITQALERHPSATEIHAQVSDWILLFLLIPLWLSGALFPLHGWFGRCWGAMSIPARLWLGAIGLKLPILKLVPLLTVLLGPSSQRLIFLLTLCSVAGLLMASCVAASTRQRHEVVSSLVLMTSPLLVLITLFQPSLIFLHMTGLTAGVVLLVLSDTELLGSRPWRGSAVILATLAVGFVPGGSGFALWREVVTPLWFGLTSVPASLAWVVLLAAVTGTVGLIQLLSGDHRAVPGEPVESVAMATASTDDSLKNSARGVVWTWGGVVVLLSLLSWQAFLRGENNITLPPEPPVTTEGDSL